MLEKLTIEGFTDDTLTASAGSCVLQINPENITHKYKVDVKPVKSIQTYKRVPRYVTRDLETLNFTFYLDATGAIPFEKSVGAKLNELRGVVYDYDGSIHQTRYLKVMWGGLTFPCALTSMDVAYELFNPSGVVLRAKVTMSFLEHITQAEVSAKSKNQSPDLSHQVMVKPGDTLPLMCYRIYGDSSHYPAVAKENGLDNLMMLEPGQMLTFPPVRG